MSVRYEETKTPQFEVENVSGLQQISLKPPRNSLTTLFLLAWLGGWTYGGIMAAKQLTSTFQLFVAFWLVAWAVAWLWAGASLAWQFSGREILRVVGSDLEVIYTVLGFSKRMLFRGADIRDFTVNSNPYPDQYRGINRGIGLPFGAGNKTGCLKFNYGSRTVYLGAGHDEAEGQMILGLLRKYLPTTATRAGSA
ncbi:MAG: hypothetical protein JO216_02560 [Hyphomicrobiales bacterium]|nr:hypothetical protein [Hyphomicrobiales bacterium]